MAGAALACRGTFPGTVLQIDSLSGEQQQALLSKPSLDNTALQANLSAGQHLPKPILLDGQKFFVLPLTLKPQNISPWQQGDKEKADKDSVSDGRKYTQARGSCIKDKVHQYISPSEAGTFGSPLLSPHSCFPLIQDFNNLFSPPVTWKT